MAKKMEKSSNTFKVNIHHGLATNLIHTGNLPLDRQTLEHQLSTMEHCQYAIATNTETVALKTVINTLAN